MSDLPLVAEGLVKAFDGVRAVDGVGFAVARGERVALIGPNGAGKTTCFNLVNGQLRPDAGRVRIAGRDVTGASPSALVGAGVARTFQITQSFASMTVVENVQTALLARAGAAWRLWGAARHRHRVEAERLLEAVGMGGAADRAAGVLAYGDLKRLELAIALALEPRVLLMDEPTAGMAPAERQALMALVSRLTAERGLALLFTEHAMDVVFGHADRVLVMDRGRLIAAGSPTVVRADPAVRAIYLGEEA